MTACLLHRIFFTESDPGPCNRLRTRSLKELCGLLGAAILFTGLAAVGVTTSCVGTSDPATGRTLSEQCTGGPSTIAQILWALLVGVLVVTPIATAAIYLTPRAQQSAAQPTAAPSALG